MISKIPFGQSNMLEASGNSNDFGENIAPNAKYLRVSRDFRDFKESIG